MPLQGAGLTRVFVRIAGCLLLLVNTCLSGEAADAYVPGRLLASIRPGVDPRLVDRTLQFHRASQKRLPQFGISILDVPEESSDAVLESLKQTGLFEYVERDFYAQMADTPNDPSYGSQWYLQQIQGPGAWDITTGANSVVIAVVDSGAFGYHPDLVTKLIPGWNFVASNSNTQDVVGHGTAVAGTVAAASNNGIGIVGVSWASRIMPLVVVDDKDSASYSNIASAIQFAADQGIRIINVSIGGVNQSNTLQKAVDYAWSRGAMVFAAAMNAGTSVPYYPAACNHAVAVSASDNIDHLASFSSYGPWITMSAPGTNILTTTNGGGYGYWSGTSFASPIVAGVAALILAVNPSLTNVDVISILEQSADDIGNPGYDTSFGWGRVNALSAVLAAKRTLPVTPRLGTSVPRSPREPSHSVAR